MVSIDECKMIELPTVTDDRGSATFCAEKSDIPFDIRRVYYLHHVPKDKGRGAHVHTREKQVVVVISGSCDVTIDDGKKRKTMKMNDPTKGLYIAPMIWREFSNFSPDGILLAIVDDFLDQSEYIRDYEEYKKVMGGKS